MAPLPPHLDVGWLSALAALRTVQPDWLAGPLLLGGRSAGARVACRTAVQLGAVGVVALAFPLHPPGRPETTRVGELTAAGVPVLVVQGERDPFGGPSAFPPDTTIHVVREADHGLAVPRRGLLTQTETLALLVEAVHRWIRVVLRA